jgi:uncharacterized NAD(P)/FAD-binding protein YdhS
MNHPHVVIIGGGCAGTLVAVQLLKRYRESPLRVTIVERSLHIGPGLAYAAPSDLCKLNVPANAMGAFPEEPQGFWRWLQERDPNISGDQFVSRRLFGLYLRDLLALYSQNTPAQIFTSITDSAEDVVWEEDIARFRITMKSGESILADACVLALGTIERETLDGVVINDAFSSPYTENSYDNIHQAREILLVGSGLTAVDVVLEAEGRGFTGNYSLLSRHGRIPLAHEPSERFIHATTSPQLSSLEQLTKLSLQELVRLVRREANRIGSSQPVIAALRPHLQELWSTLTERDKRRFMRHIRPIWEVHRHRIPEAHWQTIRNLEAAGRLRRLKGAVRSAERTTNRSKVAFHTADGVRESTFDRVFMCAGPESDPSKMRMPLIQNLLAHGTIVLGPLKLGIAPGQTSLPQHAATRLHIVGSLQREALWEITAVREIRLQAQLVAERITCGFSEPQFG